MALAGDHLILQGGSDLWAVDDTGAETVRYYEEKHRFEEAVYEEKSRALLGRWAAGKDGTLYVASSFYDYEIHVFKPSGDIDRIVERDYEHRKRTKAEKQLVYDWANVNPNALLPGTRFEIEDYDKDIMTLYCRDDGTCWVLTSRGFYDRPEGSLGVFDVFDRDGRFVKQATLMGEGDPFRDRYYFFGDRLYVLTCYVSGVATMVTGGKKENRFSMMCDEPMAVICYKM
jgi:hypothetical protein